MELTFLGHACFLLSDGRHTVLTDPFLTDSAVAGAAADAVPADLIFVTHGHRDHVGDAVAIARRTGAVVCCTPEVAAAHFAPAGIPTETGNLGGRIAMPFGSAKFFQALHSSGVPGGTACGFVFEIGGKRIYHAGDTALMSDMALLSDQEIDAALLPIGDVYTMGPEDALQAVKLIRPKLTVPMHYGTFPNLVQDPAGFVQSVRAAGSDAKALHPGESLTL